MCKPACLLSWMVSLLALGACSGGGGRPEPIVIGMSFVTESVSDGKVFTNYSTALVASGGVGTHQWTVLSGDLPPGLALDTSSTTADTTLRGTPTTEGSYQFSIQAAAGDEKVSRSFTMSIDGLVPMVGGWADIPMATNGRVVHVSETGNDSADGSLANPRRTLAGGFELLRDGQPDWLLLQRGDTFPLTGAWQWDKSGPVSGGWMRLGAYGDPDDARPVIESQDGYIVITPGYRSSRVIRNVAFTDVVMSATDRLLNSATTTANVSAISLIAVEWQGSSGQPFNDLLFENCRVSGFTFGFVSSNDVIGLTIRRCTFDHIFGAGTNHSSGALAGARNLLLEDNLFYRIMSPDIPGVGSNAYSGFSHSAYVGADASNVVSRGNIFIRTPDAVMQRAGGTYSRNVSAHTNVAGNLGQAWGVTPAPGGVLGQVIENLGLNTISESFFLGNMRGGAVDSNMLLEDLDGQGQTNFDLVARNNAGSGVNIGVHDTAFSANLVSGIISWNPAETASFSGLTFNGNQENLGPTTTSIADYLQSVGWSGNTVDDWAQHLLARDRNNYAERHLSLSVINFYRAHYALPPLN